MNLVRKMPFTIDFLQLVSILFIVEFVRGAYLISFLPTYAVDQLGFSLSIVGIAVTAHYVADTAAKTYIGYLLDRFSARTIVQSGLMLSLIGLLLLQYVQQPWMLIVTAAVFGVGASPIWLVCLSQVKEQDPAAKMGVLYMFWLVGLGMGPVVINFFIDISYIISIWIMAGLWVVGWLLSTRLPKRRIVVSGLISFGEQIQMLYERLKTMKPLLPGMILQTTAAGMLVPILPLFAAKNLGLTHSQYSLVLIAGGTCAVLGMIPMGKLSDVWGKKWFLVGGFGISALCLYMLTFSSSLKTSITLAMLLGFAYSALLPAWNATLSYHVPENQEGFGWGIFSSVEGIGVMLGPIIGGWVADWQSEYFTVIVSAIMLAVISLFYLVFPFNRLIGAD